MNSFNDFDVSHRNSDNLIDLNLLIDGFRFLLAYQENILLTAPALFDKFIQFEKIVEFIVENYVDYPNDKFIKLLFHSFNSNVVFMQRKQAYQRFDQICSFSNLEVGWEGVEANIYANTEDYYPLMRVYANSSSPKDIDIFKAKFQPDFPPVILLNDLEVFFCLETIFNFF